jgi:hypothetical protein
MNAKTRILSVAAAAAGALLLSSTSAYAEPRSPDPGVRCAAQSGPGQYEFFLPGERATDKDGNKWVCGPDGKWFRDYSSRIRVRSQVSKPLVSVARSQ